MNGPTSVNEIADKIIRPASRRTPTRSIDMTNLITYQLAREREREACTQARQARLVRAARAERRARRAERAAYRATEAAARASAAVVVLT